MILQSQNYTLITPKFPYHNSRDQLHIMTNYPTKYESYQTNNLRGVTFANITILKLYENLKSPITPTKIVESKWRDYRINQSWWPIILPNMKGTRLMVTIVWQALKHWSFLIGALGHANNWLIIDLGCNNANGLFSMLNKSLKFSYTANEVVWWSICLVVFPLTFISVTYWVGSRQNIEIN